VLLHRFHGSAPRSARLDRCAVSDLIADGRCQGRLRKSKPTLLRWTGRKPYRTEDSRIGSQFGNRCSGPYLSVLPPTTATVLLVGLQRAYHPRLARCQVKGVRQSAPFSAG
jgi:hypothetical protein